MPGLQKKLEKDKSSYLQMPGDLQVMKSRNGAFGPSRAVLCELKGQAGVGGELCT